MKRLVNLTPKPMIAENENMKCPDCGAEMIPMYPTSAKERYAKTYVCPKIRYHKLDAENHAILLPCFKKG